MSSRCSPVAALVACSLAATLGLTLPIPACVAVAHAEPASQLARPALPERWSVMAGMTQWTLFRGGNLAFEYMRERLVLEVSHGQGLDLNQLPGLALTPAERDAGARVYVPWTTGFGVGVRITRHLHVLFELKAHHYRVSAGDRNSELEYTTISVGPSVFYTIPLWRGLFLEPNLRWWPNVGSTLPGDRGELRQRDGSTYLHEAHDFGLFANVNLGWTF